MRSSILILLTMLFTVGCSKQNDLQSSGQTQTLEEIANEKNDFEFDHDIVRKFALTAMEEYNHHNSNRKLDFSNDYLIDKPLFCGKNFIDCNKEKVKVIIVVFESKDIKRGAYVKLIYDKDNYVNKILDRTYGSESAQAIINSFRSLLYPEIHCIGTEQLYSIIL